MIDWSKFPNQKDQPPPAPVKAPPIPSTPPSGHLIDWSKFTNASSHHEPDAPDFDAAATPESPLQKIGRGLGSALGTVGNALDLPLAAGEAIATGKGLDQIGKDLQAGGGWSNPAGALSNVAENDVYFRKGSLQRVIDDPHADAGAKGQAQYLLSHPWVAAIGDFATEFANPSNLLMGGVGRALGAVSHLPAVAQSIDEAQAFTRVGSRFAGVRAAARDVGFNPQEAENWARGLINKGNASDEEAYHEAMRDFGDLTKSQQEEVIHRAQGNVVNSFGAAKDAEINERGKSVAKNLWQTTRDQMREGTIDPSKVYGKEQMFPEVFSDVELPPIEGAIEGGPTAAAHFRPLSKNEANAIASYARGEVPEEASEFTPLIKERGDKLKDLLASDEPPSPTASFFPMKGAFNEPGADEEYLEYLQHHVGSGGGKTAIRKGSAGLSTPQRTYDTLLDAQQNSTRGLRADWSPAESYYRFLAQRKKNVALEGAMKDLVETGLAKPEAERTLGDRFANVGDIQAARMFGSPTLKQTAAHQHVINFLEEVGATKGEASSFASATSSLGRVARAIGPAYQASQSILRQAVISNPIIHAGWNLMGQYLAAGGDIRYLAGVNEAMAKDAERLGAITSRGAPRSISGGSAIALASRPTSDLNAVEKVGRAAATAQEWNAKVVFDGAERRYASALFQTYVKRGMNPAEAGNRVRQALGDYANVANAGMDKYLKQAFFFYPWLKTILPFWIKAGVTKPQTWTPITAGIATQNEVAGDPNAGSSAEGPFTLYTGSSAEGRPEYYSVPVVGRILGQIGDFVGGALTNNRDEAKKGFQSLFLNRLNPAVGAALGAGQSVVSGTTQPEGPLGYAPVLERLRNGIAGMGNYIPAPVKGAYDAAQILLGHETLKPSVVAGELVGGTGFVSTTPTQKLAAARIRNTYYRIINASLKRDDRATAWRAYQLMQRSLQAAGLGQDDPVRNPEKADELNPMPQQLPAGASELEAVEPTEAPETETP